MLSGPQKALNEWILTLTPQGIRGGIFICVPFDSFKKTLFEVYSSIEAVWNILISYHPYCKMRAKISCKEKVSIYKSVPSKFLAKTESFLEYKFYLLCP